MNPGLAQRQIALAGVGLLAIVVALAVASFDGVSSDGPGSVPVASGGWYEALAAPYRFEPGTKRTACGLPAGPRTLGIAHPVLPCGAKIVVEYGERQVLTQVVDRGGRPGRALELTAPLAKELELQGVQTIRWRFAQR